MFGTDIAIDLGTSSVKIFVAGQGVVLNEPAAVSLDLKTNGIFALGELSHRMLGKTCDEVDVIFPLQNGVIADFDLTEKLLTTFISRITNDIVFMPRVAVCVPSEITEVEKRAVFDVLYNAGARKVFLIQSPIAAALGADINIFKPSGRMVVDIGAGTSDIAIIALSDIIASGSVKIGGNVFDSEIIRYVKNKYNLLIGIRTAQEIKKSIGSVHMIPKKYFCVKGKNSKTGMPQWGYVTSEEIRPCLVTPALKIIEGIEQVLAKSPPDMISEIFIEGITLTGGSSLISGFDTLITKKLRIPTHVAKDPENCVILGAGKSLEYMGSTLKIHEQKSIRQLTPLSKEFV